MDAYTYSLLAVFSGVAYGGAVLFLWAIHKESAVNVLGNPAVVRGTASVGVDAGGTGFVRSQWKSLLTLALVFGGGFGFFITHVCQYD